MKFFHLSDLHLGISLKGYSLEEDQREVLSQIVSEAERQKPEAIVIAGDIYDKPDPSAMAVRLFDWFVGSLRAAAPNAQILIVAGNHDSGDRLAVHSGILAMQGVHIQGLPPVGAEGRLERVDVADPDDQDGSLGPVRFYLLPFVRPSMVADHVRCQDARRQPSYQEAVRELISREDVDPACRNVIVSHQYYVPAGDRHALEGERMDSEMPVVGNVDAVDVSVLDPFDYAALGHLHKPMSAGRPNCRYCGTPMPYSVSEAGQQKGILVVEMGGKGEVGTSVVPLTPPHGIRKVEGTYADILAMPDEECQDYTRVVLTDSVEIEVFELNRNMRAKFPRLLEIDWRREGTGPVDAEVANVRERTVAEICLDFLGGEATRLQRDILDEVIRQAQEVE